MTGRPRPKPAIRPDTATFPRRDPLRGATARNVLVLALLGTVVCACSTMPLSLEARRNVELGMTRAEVAHALGKKPNRYLTLDESARRAAWEYRAVVAPGRAESMEVEDLRTGAKSSYVRMQGQEEDDVYFVFDGEELVFMGTLLDLRFEASQSRQARRTKLLLIEERLLAQGADR